MGSATRLQQCSFTRSRPYYALPRRTILPAISKLTHLCLEDFESVDDCLAILRDTRKLTHCSLDLGRVFEISIPTPVRLSELKSMQILAKSGIPHFLDNFVLPTLNELDVHFQLNSRIRYNKADNLWPQSQFTSLICRSSCRLTRLHFKSVPLSKADLLQCLKHTSLSLREIHIEDVRPLVCITDAVL
jgi:hypothetical protein